MTEQEWLQKRKSGITGTGASAIMGYGYLNNVEYWELKTGKRSEPDLSGNPLVQYGQQAERHLISLFALDYPEYDVVHKDFDLRVHPQHPFLLGSLDGELTEKTTGRKGILEIKTATIMNRTQWDKWEGGIPMNYFYQVLHYLLVTGFDFVILKAQLKLMTDKIETRHYRFDRSEVREQIDELLKKELDFWQFVRKDIRPALKLPRI